MWQFPLDGDGSQIGDEIAVTYKVDRLPLPASADAYYFSECFYTGGTFPLAVYNPNAGYEVYHLKY
jgi:hypothetical protein